MSKEKMKMNEKEVGVGQFQLIECQNLALNCSCYKEAANGPFKNKESDIVSTNGSFERESIFEYWKFLHTYFFIFPVSRNPQYEGTMFTFPHTSAFACNLQLLLREQCYKTTFCCGQRYCNLLEHLNH